MRDTIVQILLAIENQGAYPADALARAIENETPTRARYIRRCVYGVLEEKEALEALLRERIRPGIRVKKDIRLILMAAMYQLLRFDTVKAHAVVDASVRIVKKKDPRAAAFANGVLRSIARERETLKRRLPDKVLLPDHVRKRLENSLGAERTEALAKSLLQPPHLCVRINPLRAQPDSLRKHFEAAGMPLTPSRLSPVAYRVTKPVRVAESSMFLNGECTIQDEASSLVVLWGAPKPNEQWLDVCAAPGGKSTQLAESMGDTGTVLACDIYPAKLERIRAHAERLRLRSIFVEQNDASVVREEWNDRFDGVLVDAPCSGLGLLRRKPDIAYNRSEADFEELIVLQKKILDAAAAAVRPGGTLLYSTCTVLREENEEQIRAFLERNREFRADGDDFERNIDMAVTGADGFYMARLKRLPL